MGTNHGKIHADVDEGKPTPHRYICYDFFCMVIFLKQKLYIISMSNIVICETTWCINRIVFIVASKVIALIFDTRQVATQ